MSEEAKIHLSTFETELVNDTQWIFAKQIIIEKVSRLLGALQVRYRNLLEDHKDMPEEFLLRQGAKISKGENYKGLPYLILDYPAIFGKEHICAVRTMFWWGNYFSISLHLSGRYFTGQNNFSEWLPFLKENNFFVCINKNEWEHHFSALNYIEAHELSGVQIAEIKEKSFFKAGKKIALTEWESAPEFLEKTFREMIGLLTLAT